MSVSAMHLFQQGRGLYSTLRVAASAIGGRPDSMSELPGPEIYETISVIPDDLIDAAVRWAGGDPAAYSDILPPWMFAWWGIPVFAHLVTTTPFPPLRIVNQGFAVQQLKHLPRGQDLLLRARVMDLSLIHI